MYNDLDKLNFARKSRRKFRDSKVEASELIAEIDKSFMTVFIGAIAQIENVLVGRMEKQKWDILRKSILDSGNRERRRILEKVEKFLKTYIFDKGNGNGESK